MIQSSGKTIRVKCSDIIWDTDGNKKIAKALPQCCYVDIEDYEEDDDLDEEIADALSDLTDFCVEGFYYTIENNK